MPFTIRAARLEDVPGIAHVHVETWKTTYRGIVPDRILDNLKAENRAAQWNRVLSNPESAEFVYVAVDDADTVVGFLSGGPERENTAGYDGELYAIYVLQTAQGAGIGRALTEKCIQRLMAQHYKAMLVWVLAENPSRKFYEALGGHYIKEKALDFDGTPITEVAYGWPDLSQFVGLTQN